MTRTVYAGLTLGSIVLIALIGFIVMNLLTGEYWCGDRWPWWGPPQDPSSTCSGLSWASRHPGEYPWTMPK